jgi:hypothetical protein
MADFPAQELAASVDVGSLGATYDDTATQTLADPGDAVPPTIGNFIPAVGTPLVRSDVVQFDVLDNVSALRRVIVIVTLGGETFVVHDGFAFRGQFSNLSTRSAIVGGFRFNVRRNGGWTNPPTFEVHAVDTSGNEAI